MGRIVGLGVLEEKAPWFGKTRGKAILLASLILPLLAYLTFFWWLDRLLPYGSLISQFGLALVPCAICYLGMRRLIYDIRAKLEDEDLTERFGKEHRRYIRETPAIFPHLRNLGRVLGLFCK